MSSEPTPSAAKPSVKKRPLSERLSSEHYLAMRADLHELRNEPMSKELVNKINELQRKYEALAKPE